MYKKPAMTYFKDEDILHLLISEGVEASSIEVAPNITVELNAEGDILGIEILMNLATQAPAMNGNAIQGRGRMGEAPLRLLFFRKMAENLSLVLLGFYWGFIGVLLGFYWRAMRDSNPRPLAPEANALSN